MYFDEDGDLAHEFYVEIKAKKSGGKARMKRILHGLTPQVIHRFFTPPLENLQLFLHLTLSGPGYLRD